MEVGLARRTALFDPGAMTVKIQVTATVKVGRRRRGREPLLKRGRCVVFGFKLKIQRFYLASQSVMVTLKKILGSTGEVALESLLVSGSILQHIPVPYLQRVCTTLISIWKGVQQVSVSVP